MSENEQNLINKINEQRSIIEWQKKAIESREQHIKSLEAQLANTKQLKCDGCAYSDDKYGCQCPLICKRDAEGEVKDFYTSKDTQ